MYIQGKSIPFGNVYYISHCSVYEKSFFLKTTDIMSDIISPEKTHDKHAKCLSKFIGFSAINHVNIGQNV